MPIDRQRVIAIAGGDIELANQLLTIYIERARNIAEALAAGDPASSDRLGDLAHGIRGSALAVGADEVAELALSCMNGAGAGDLATRTQAREALIAGVEGSAREAALALLQAS